MVQPKVVLNYAFEEKSEYYQKVCLGGLIKSPDDIASRMDSAEENFMNSCWKCFMKNHKHQGACDTDTCPVKSAHRKVMNMLFKIDDFMDLHPDTELPYVDATNMTLEEVLFTWNTFMDEYKNNTGKQTGLDKIKTFFGGK